MVGGGRPLLPEILGKTDPSPLKTAISNLYSLFARSASAVTPSEKSLIITN